MLGNTQIFLYDAFMFDEISSVTRMVNEPSSIFFQ